MAVDFLPLCDLLFNFISVSTYFCDIAFDIIVTYTLFIEAKEITWFCILFLIIVFSVLLCQILSLKWYIDEENRDTGRLAWTISITVHFLLTGVLWRYARLLFVPIDISLVKREMRNLSILRMIHGFVQCLVSVLIQGYILLTRDDLSNRSIYYTSCCLSLVNICWALASFNKNISKRNIHKLILTWIGVISQFLWRIGTVGSRLLALVLYSSAYDGWIFLFAALHWICMLTWLIFQHNESHVKHISYKFVIKCLILSAIYMIDFVNMEDASSKFRLFLYYMIVFIENMLLVTLWATFVSTTILFTVEERTKAFILTTAPFFIGLVFMVIYYQVFHVNKTSHGLNSSNYSEQQTTIKVREEKHNNSSQNLNKTVFNCALNPAMKKRKKIPRVIPPPPPEITKPFWKEPLPSNGHADGPSVSPDLIRQKLEAKREKEVEELRGIQMRNAGLDLQVLRQQYYTEHLTDTVYVGPTKIHDSSGDQGDIDSNEEVEWNLSNEDRVWDGSSNFYNLPTDAFKASRLRGYKAETQL